MYKKREVIELLGQDVIESRRLQFITDQQLISDATKYPGRGRDRFYSKINLVEIYIVQELASFGFSTEKIKNIMSSVSLDSENLYRVFSPTFLIISPDFISTRQERDEFVVTVSMDGLPSAIILNLNYYFEKVQRILNITPQEIAPRPGAKTVTTGLITDPDKLEDTIKRLISEKM